MEKTNFGQLVSFIFSIANDCLVDIYDVGDYRKIILPMMVIRRFDAVLEPTKEEVLKMKKRLDDAGITEQDEALCSVAGEAFCNSSRYTLSDLKSRTNQQQLKADFILYLDGFSQNVQDIIKRFEFRNQIDKLSEHDVLGLLINKFTNQSINLSSRPVITPAGIKLPALDNHSMGTVFEEVIRRFNEETNVTDAGRHFTPRDIVELMADLAFVPVKDKIQDTTYRIYDGRIVQARVIAVAEKAVRIEAFGVECSIMARDLSWDWIGDAHDRFSVGDQVLVRILSVKRDNIEDLSIKADIKSVSENTNRDNLQKCRIQSKYAGKVTDVHKGVVYVRLTNGVNAVAHSCYDRRMPGKKDDVSFAVTHIDEERGVAVGIITRIIKQNL